MLFIYYTRTRCRYNRLFRVFFLMLIKLVVQACLNLPWILNANKQEEIPCPKNVCEVSTAQSSALKFLFLKHLLFCVFFCAYPTEMVFLENLKAEVLQVPQKSMNRVCSHFSIFVHRVVYFKTLFAYTGHHFPGWI